MLFKKNKENRDTKSSILNGNFTLGGDKPQNALMGNFQSLERKGKDAKGIAFSLQDSDLGKTKKIIEYKRSKTENTTRGFTDVVEGVTGGLSSVSGSVGNLSDAVSGFELPTIQTNNSLDKKSMLIFGAVGVALLFTWSMLKGKKK